MIAIIKKGSPKKMIQQAWNQLFVEKQAKGVAVKKYCGTLKLDQDALERQKELRSEW